MCLVRIKPLLSSLVFNFTNIFLVAFSNESLRAAFLYLHFRFAIFWQMNIGAKATQKNDGEIETWGIQRIF